MNGTSMFRIICCIHSIGLIFLVISDIFLDSAKFPVEIVDRTYVGTIIRISTLIQVVLWFGLFCSVIVEIIHMETPAKTINNYINELIYSMPEHVRSEFSQFERTNLQKAMYKCCMCEYPEVIGDKYGIRASGECECKCGMKYREHPLDWRMTECDKACLHILCDGTRVKL